jgi:hypothetical protein
METGLEYPLGLYLKEIQDAIRFSLFRVIEVSLLCTGMLREAYFGISCAVGGAGYCFSSTFSSSLSYSTKSDMESLLYEVSSSSSDPQVESPISYLTLNTIAAAIFDGKLFLIVYFQMTFSVSEKHLVASSLAFSQVVDCSNTIPFAMKAFTKCTGYKIIRFQLNLNSVALSHSTISSNDGVV